jgi:hypothetical protein
MRLYAGLGLVWVTTNFYILSVMILRRLKSNFLPFFSLESGQCAILFWSVALLELVIHFCDNFVSKPGNTSSILTSK